MECHTKRVFVAQLVRASDCGSEGRRFKSTRTPHGEVIGFDRNVEIIKRVRQLWKDTEKLLTGVQATPLFPIFDMETAIAA